MAEQYGFYVDTTRCIKCWACEVACKQWHEVPANATSRRNVQEETTGTYPDVKRTFTSLSCMHCETPACVENCPVGALAKREEDGLVVVDVATCIGCQTCASACPFGVPQYADNEGGSGKHLEKCDGCLSVGRAADEMPHCVLTCPLEALHFGTLAEMEALATERGGKKMEGTTGPSVFIS